MKKQMKALAVLLISLCLGSCGGSVSESGTKNTGAPPSDNSTIKLPKTGQTISYGTGAIDDGALQKGVSWPNPRFASGTGGEVACVTDNLTGLMWAKIPDSTLRTWQESLAYANGLLLCGHNDWRMPNRAELRSIINYSQPNIADWLNDPAQGFSNVQTGYYWTSSSDAKYTVSAWGVDMRDGEMRPGGKTYLGTAATHYVWPVRSSKSVSTAPARVRKTGQTACYDATGNIIDCSTTAGQGQDGALQEGVAWPSQRFTVGAGAEADCVTDNLTGLMWVKIPNISARWQEALNFAAVLNLCGYADWRLPNMNELESLVHLGHNEVICSAPSTNCTTNAEWLNNQGFSNVQAGYYWTSTTYADVNTAAWLVDMNMVFSDGNDKSNQGYVWPVRGGQ